MEGPAFEQQRETDKMPLPGGGAIGQKRAPSSDLELFSAALPQRLLPRQSVDQTPSTGGLPPRPNLDSLKRSLRPPAAENIQGPALSAALKTAGMYRQIFSQMFSSSADGALVQDQELADAGKKLNLSGAELLARGVKQLAASEGTLKYDRHGRMLNPEAAGEHLAALIKLLHSCAEYYVLRDSGQLQSARADLPFSDTVHAQFCEIAARGEVAALLLIKKPPLAAAKEIQNVTNAHMRGLLRPWEDKRFVKSLSLSPALRAYLEHATVRVLCTGADGRTLKITKELNERLEDKGGFEDLHSFKVTRSVAQNEKQESLRHSLYVCGVLIAAVKTLEVLVPNALHAVSGMLDDALSAGPGLSQDLGPKSLPWRARIKPILPGLKALGLSLAAAAALGYGAAHVYTAFPQHPAMGALAGLMFAFACCGGTLGVASSAVKNKFQAVREMQQSAECPEQLRELGFAGRLKLAFAEAIWSSPFRIGQIGLGVPLQIGLGIAAGLAGFFHHPAFVMLEGAAETILGAAVAFAYPVISSVIHRRKLRRFLSE